LVKVVAFQRRGRGIFYHIRVGRAREPNYLGKVWALPNLISFLTQRKKVFGDF